MNVDSLVADNKWGGTTAPGVSLSYSFPWINGANAWFAGYNGQAYSPYGEWTASYRAGLNSTQQVAAKKALEAWSDIANITFTRVQDNESTVGDIRFAFSSAEGLTKWFGWAHYPNTYWPSAGDIWINYKYAQETDWSVGSTNYNSLLHEIGHALGLKHPFADDPIIPAQYDSTQYTVMSYTAPAKNLWVTVTNSGSSYLWSSKYITPESPMTLDIAAIQYMYGKNSSYRTGDDIYRIDAASPFLKTIWDAGGIDTVDASAFVQRCTINLNPGTYSSLGFRSNWFDFKNINWETSPDEKEIYDGSNNLGIAFDCWIENAAGGSGNDAIYGNSVGNILTGNSGNDTLFAGDGNDSLEGGDGSDTLYGDAGNDTFDWAASSRSGSDSFHGGLGNDTYVLTNDDSVYEFSNEGEDTVWVNFSYVVPNDCYVENVFGFGSSKLLLTGSNRDERFQGSSNSDTIDGREGTDTAIYTGSYSQYYFSQNGNSYVISDSVSNRDGADTILNIEFVKFSDKTVAVSELISQPNTGKVSVSGTATNSVGKNESVVGSSQIDKFIYTTAASTYQVNYFSGRVAVKNTASGEEDSLTNVERLKFTDKSIAFDFTGNAGKAYRVYKAAFARDPQSGDMSGLGFWISRIDSGMDMVEVAARFIDSNEFRSLYGQNPTNAEFLTKVYTNVLGRTPDQGGYDWWLNELNTNPSKTKAKVLADFAESGENQSGVATLIGNGISYTEFVT